MEKIARLGVTKEQLRLGWLQLFLLTSLVHRTTVKDGFVSHVLEQIRASSCNGRFVLFPIPMSYSAVDVTETRLVVPLELYSLQTLICSYNPELNGDIYHKHTNNVGRFFAPHQSRQKWKSSLSQFSLDLPSHLYLYFYFYFHFPGWCS